MQTTNKYFSLCVMAGLVWVLPSGNTVHGQGLPKAGAGPEFGTWGVDLTGMDKSVKPGDDFYSYVNGTWHAQAEIPSDKTSTGPTVTLTYRAFDQVKTILEEAAADTKAAKGSDRQKIGDWYASLMDEQKLVALGLKPIQPDLDRIERIENRTALADLLADNHSGLGAVPLSVSAGWDRRRVDKMLVTIGTGGLSMPAREFYLEPGADPIRKLYREHLVRVFKLAGMDNGLERAERVLKLETLFAQVTCAPSRAT